MFAKHILGVNRKTINLAVLAELGLQPLKIDMKINSLKFFDYINQNRNRLLKDTLEKIDYYPLHGIMISIR